MQSSPQGSCSDALRNYDPYSADKAAPRLIVLSAKTKPSLFASVEKLCQWSSSHREKIDLEDLAFTLSTRRTFLQWRFAFLARSFDDLTNITRDLSNQEHRLSSLYPRVTFVFTGQGAQWYAMGRELILACSQFKTSLCESSSVLHALGASWDLVEELRRSKSDSKIDQSKYAQPACTAIQIALVDVLKAIGVRPTTVLGHSSGEIAAAYASGVLSHAAAIRVAYFRGMISDVRTQSDSPEGAMLAVGLSEERTEMHIQRLGLKDLCVACANSPASTTVSGGHTSIHKLHENLSVLSIYSKVLQVDTAYHSHYMHEAAPRYLKHLKDLESTRVGKAVKLVSTVTAREKHANFGPEYWIENLVSKVRFSDAILKFCSLEKQLTSLMKGRPKLTMVEIGPHPALNLPTNQTIQDRYADEFELDYFPTFSREQCALTSFLRLVGKLFICGVSVDFKSLRSILSSKAHCTVVHSLPSYAWDHSQQYWHESRLSKEHRFREHPYHDLLGTRIESSTSLEPRWRHLISVDRLPWLQGHMVDDLIIFPGAAYLSMAIEAARQLFTNLAVASEFKFQYVQFEKALVIPPASAGIEVQLSLTGSKHSYKSAENLSWTFRISAMSSNAAWSEHCSGLLTVGAWAEKGDSTVNGNASSKLFLADNQQPVKAADPVQVDPNLLYQRLKANGNCYDSTFAAVKAIRLDNPNQATSKVVIPDVARTMPGYRLSPHLFHPSTLDALMHSALTLFIDRTDPGSIMPMGIEEIRISSGIVSTPGRSFDVQTTLTTIDDVTARADITATDPVSSAQPVVQISGLKLRCLTRSLKMTKESTPTRSIAFKLKWIVDVDTFTPSCFPTKIPVPAEKKVHLLNRAASMFIERSLRALDLRSHDQSELHHINLVAWMRRQRYNVSCSTEVEKLVDESFLQRMHHQDIEGHMLCRIGQNLLPILERKIEPLDLMTQDDDLYKFYSRYSGSRCNAHLAFYVKNLCLKRPIRRILEVGAGTGSTTLPVLEALRNEKISLGEYVFTDISAGWFDKARELLDTKDYAITYRTLDVSRGPELQGFTLHTFDLVIAANVLHATESVGNSLANIRKLLRSGGKLALVEVTQPHLYLGLIFGTLPGWWKGDISL